MSEIFPKNTTQTRIIPFKVEMLRNTLMENKELMAKFWKVIVPKLVYLRDDLFPLFKSMKMKKLKHWFDSIEKSDLAIYNQGSQINMPAGGILWQG